MRKRILRPICILLGGCMFFGCAKTENDVKNKVSEHSEEIPGAEQGDKEFLFKRTLQYRSVSLSCV